MNTQIYTQQITKDLLTLPKDRILEVIDFVQFLKSKVQQQGISLKEAGLTQEEAIDLRTRLSTFENDWNVPDMDIYDEL